MTGAFIIALLTACCLASIADFLSNSGRIIGSPKEDAMTHFKAAVCFASFFTIALAAPAWAQSGTMAIPKTISENDKMVVAESIGKPGESSASIERQGQFYYYVQGGNVELTYDDGTKATVVRKTGESRIVTDKRAYSAKNIGTTTLRVIIVTLK